MKRPTILLGMLFVLLFAGGLRAGQPRESSGRGPTMMVDGVGQGPGSAGARARAEIPTTVGVGWGPTRHGSAVYPAQTLPLRFNHGQHLALGLVCQTCHVDIDGSRKASDNNFPRGQVCDRCHGDQHPRPQEAPAQCELCHTDVRGNRVTSGLRAPKPLLHFNHRLHAEKGSTCTDCHGDMRSVRLATTLQLPREQQCLTCHDGVEASARCGACHPTARDGRLVTRAVDDRSLPALIPRGQSAWGATHDLAFVEDHQAIAKAQPRLCESCHAETFCTDCHAGALRPLRLHPADYVQAHAVDATARAQDCQSCHRTQTFCLGCHERLGFGERSQGPFGVGGGLAFHPPGWAGPPGQPQSHAHAAQRNLAACTSCHQEDSCLACHATTQGAMSGLGVNPHGPGFRQSPKCTALSNANRRVCLRCHAPGVPELECL